MKIKSFAKLPIISFVAMSFLLNCKQDDTDVGNTIKEYRAIHLANIYDYEIARLNVAFIESTTILSVSMHIFHKKTTLENLVKTQNQWKKTVRIWKQIELYNIGAISKKFLHFQIGEWPTNEAFIAKFVIEATTIDEAYIISKGASSKGVSALEFLLFNKETNEAVLESFISDDNHENRLKYLVSVSENLKTEAILLAQDWTEYKDEFVSNLDNGVTGSQNMVINEMVASLEEILIYKLGKPLGGKNNGVIDLEKLEASKSGMSLVIIKENLMVLERCFLGEFTGVKEAIGFDDSLVLMNAENIVEVVKNNLKICYQKIDVINGTLKEELQNNPEVVIDLREAIKDLLVVVKVDMANTLGFTITFNDNDGD